MTPAPPSAFGPLTEHPHAWAHQWMRPMLRFAMLHIQPREEAEDAVQDTLVAALGLLQSPEDPRRYLFGILKHKITDRLRQKYRHGRHLVTDDDDSLDEALFDERGHWQADVAPATWHCPASQLQTDQFFKVVDACIERLPAKTARVFSMKELLECEPAEVCSTLGLSQADYWQCMSRARKQIQLCLSERWFNEVTR